MIFFYNFYDICLNHFSIAATENDGKQSAVKIESLEKF